MVKKIAELAYMGEDFEKCVSFSSASTSAKKFHFGASLRCTGIKVHSLGINTYSSDHIFTVASTVL